jgi:hypothetical protein
MADTSDNETLQTRETMLAALERAKARYASMSPAEKAVHDQAQRESWVRANMPTGDPRFD